MRRPVNVVRHSPFAVRLFREYRRPSAFEKLVCLAAVNVALHKHPKLIEDGVLTSLMICVCVCVCALFMLEMICVFKRPTAS